MKTLMTIIITAICHFQIAASGTSLPNLFDYSVVIDAQKKCDGTKLGKIPLAVNRKSVYSIASQTLAVVSDLSLKEVKRNKKPERGETRDFELRYKLYALLACGKEPQFVNGAGNSVLELPVVEHAWKDPQHLAIVGDEPAEPEVRP